METPTESCDGLKMEVTLKCGARSTTQVVSLADWCVGPDRQSLEKRSDVIHAIAHCQRADYLKKVLNEGWDAEEALLLPRLTNCPIPGNIVRYRKTAFQHFIQKSWIEGIKLLLDAGYNINSPLQTNIKMSHLKFVLMKCGENAEEIVRLLLDYGADPNIFYHLRSPLKVALRRKDNDCENILKLLIEHGAKVNSEHCPKRVTPLVLSLQKSSISSNIIRLLLENGADPNLQSPLDRGFVIPLSAALPCVHERPHASKYAKTKDADEVTAIVKMRELIKYGAEINHCTKEAKPPLHTLASYNLHYDLFHLKTLDFLYQNGCNLEMTWEDCGTALQHAVNMCNHTNTLRWLVRHGARTQSLDIKVTFPYSKERISWKLAHNYIQNVLLLVQTGMQLSKSEQFHLEQMGRSTEDLLGTAENQIDEKLLWENVIKWFSELSNAVPEKETKGTSHNYLTSTLELNQHKASHLEEFSDESLDIYTTDNLYPNSSIELWKTFPIQVQEVVDFLSQPQTLAWFCRQSVRQNLVSLTPCVVRTLPLPPALKRYIMCHDI